MYPNHEHFSRYFVDKTALLYQMAKLEKGDNLSKYFQNSAKS